MARAGLGCVQIRMGIGRQRGRNGSGRLHWSDRPALPWRGTLAAMAELKTEQILALLAPIVIIQLGLMIAALIDLEREERRVRGGNKLVWAVVIVVVNIIGPIAYFIAGRDEA
jgi:hypothetical protein